MRFQVGGLVGNKRVACGMSTRESVSGKWGKELPNDLRRLPVNAVHGHAGQELLPLLLEQRLDLLADGFPQCVGFGQGETGEIPGDLHHLFLVDADAVGIL